MRIVQIFFAVFTVVLFAATGPARAQQASDMVDVRLLPGWRTAEGLHIAAIEMRLRPGWMTYWRAPGDAGIPPEFDWRRSKNLTGVEIVWPTPTIRDKAGVRTIGYSDVLILPIRVLPVRAGGDVTLRGRIEMGVCSDICVPVDVSVSGQLPKAASKPDPRIAAALASRPDTAVEAGVRAVTCSISPIDGGLGLRAEVDMPGAAGYKAAVIEVDNPQIWVAPAKMTHQGNRLIADTRLYHAEGRSFALDRSGVRITVLGNSRAVDIQGCTAG